MVWLSYVSNQPYKSLTHFSEYCQIGESELIKGQKSGFSIKTKEEILALAKQRLK